MIKQAQHMDLKIKMDLNMKHFNRTIQILKGM